MASEFRWPLVAGGVAVGIAGTLTAQAMLGPVKIPDGLGGLIGGCAAVMSAALAWTGFTRWETRHRKERQAEIADDALAVASEVCALLRRIAGQEDFSPPGYGQFDVDLFETWQALIWEPGIRERFTKARVQVEAYLSDEAHAAIEGLWELTLEVDQVLDVAIHTADRGFASERGSKALDDLLGKAGSVLRMRIDDRLTEIKNHLHPLALLR